MAYTYVHNAPFINKAFMVTGAFGEWRGNTQHKGLDLAPVGFAGSLYAIDDFDMIYKGFSASYGYYVIFRNSSNMMYLYAHMDVAVSGNVGDHYSHNQYIAEAGSTGTGVTGVHVHLQMQRGISWVYSDDINDFVNPCDYLTDIANVVNSTQYYYDGTPVPPPTPTKEIEHHFPWYIYDADPDLL